MRCQFGSLRGGFGRMSQGDRDGEARPEWRARRVKVTIGSPLDSPAATTGEGAEPPCRGRVGRRMIGTGVRPRFTGRRAHAARPSVLGRPGVCWRCARAAKASPLIDGAAYFAALAEALERARRSVFVL